MSPRLTGVRGGCVLAVLAASVAHAQVDGITVAGSATKGGNTASGQLLFDPGADFSVVSRAWATTLGLLDGSGNPVGHTGDLGANRKPNGTFTYEFWCFDGVSLKATDSNGNDCSATQTVYVSKTNDFIAGQNILGIPWQKAVDLGYRAKTAKLTWPVTPPPPPAKTAVAKVDTRSGLTHPVFDVSFTLGGATAAADLRAHLGFGYTIIPQKVALTLGVVPTGQIDLLGQDPQAWSSLALSDQVITDQAVFPTGMIDQFDIGIGPPGSSIEVLISDDRNSDFGIMGDNLLQGELVGSTFLFTAIDDTIWFNVPAPGAALPLAMLAIWAARRRRATSRVLA